MSGFAEHRDEAVAQRSSADENLRLGYLVHELRNHLQTATLAFGALESGRLAIGGSTAGLVRRSLSAATALLRESISDVRRQADKPKERIQVGMLVSDAGNAAQLNALTLPNVDPTWMVDGDRQLLTAALVNLLQNAFKFTHARTEVQVAVTAVGDRVYIDVQDHCGGLPDGAAERLFRPFTQVGADRSGLGLGLSIAKRNIEADGGTIAVRDLPGEGCVFTVDLPRLPRS